MSSLSLTPTTTLAFPKGFLAGTNKQGFSTASNSPRRVGIIVSAQPNDDALKVKYEKLLKEVEPLATKHLSLKKKRIERKVEMWNEDGVAVKEAQLARRAWYKKMDEVTELQNQLGIVVDKSTEGEDEAFMPLKEKYYKLGEDLCNTRQKYDDSRTKRFEKKFMDTESEEEMLAWESYEKKKVEYGEILLQMYILRPGMDYF